MGEQLSQLLEPIAAWFGRLGIPEPITRWGHPVMMGTVILMMGSYVAYSGWKARLTEEVEVSAKYRAEHRQLAPWMFLFLAMGYSGGILSLVMQHHAVLESPHFWTGSVALLLLGLTSSLALFGFAGEEKSTARTVHAYLGAGIMILLLVHIWAGLSLGFSL
jgi:hypothetical protein